MHNHNPICSTCLLLFSSTHRALSVPSGRDPVALTPCIGAHSYVLMVNNPVVLVGSWNSSQAGSSSSLRYCCIQVFKLLLPEQHLSRLYFPSRLCALEGFHDWRSQGGFWLMQKWTWFSLSVCWCLNWCCYLSKYINLERKYRTLDEQGLQTNCWNSSYHLHSISKTLLWKEWRLCQHSPQSHSSCVAA